MTARHWWAGVLVLTIALLTHLAFPRYDWRTVPGSATALVRIDRWTGRAEWGVVRGDTGQWVVLRAKSGVSDRPTTGDATDKMISDIDKALAGK